MFHCGQGLIQELILGSGSRPLRLSSIAKLAKNAGASFSGWEGGGGVAVNLLLRSERNPQNLPVISILASNALFQQLVCLLSSGMWYCFLRNCYCYKIGIQVINKNVC